MFLKETLAISCFWLAVSELPRLRAPTAEQCKWTAEFYCPEIVPTSFARCCHSSKLFGFALKIQRLNCTPAYRTWRTSILSTLLCPCFLRYIIYSTSRALEGGKKNILKNKSNWVRDGRRIFVWQFSTHAEEAALAPSWAIARRGSRPSVFQTISVPHSNAPMKTECQSIVWLIDQLSDSEASFPWVPDCQLCTPHH